jgi:hypothetical protein
MAKRKDIEAMSGEPAASPDAGPEQAQARNEFKSELPTVESPSISPGTPAPKIEPKFEPMIDPKIEPIAQAAPAIEPVATAAPASAPARQATAQPAPTVRPRITLNARHKRNALLAASVAMAAALGALVGAVASGGLSASLPRTDVAGLEENKSMQQSITRLAKEITALKLSLDAANKTAHTQIAKITDRAASSDITGSIQAPQTVSPAAIPRPAPRFAAVEGQPPARPPVVQDWVIRDARDGFVYVQGHGDIYQVVLGAPLPGLGPVQSVKRQDGRWVVTTPKGIIVSMRDRRYFESF